MNRRQISALLVLRELEIKQQMESFDERLSVQKSIYLAQASGVDLGHYFNWYLRGPYAPSLTQDVFDAVQNYDIASLLQGWVIDDKTGRKLSKLRDGLEPPPSLSKPSWLELLASVHFLIDRHQVPGLDVSLITEQLKKFRKLYTLDQVAEALSRLGDLSLLPQS